MRLLMWLTGASRRAMSTLRRYEWLSVGLLGLSALALGFIGFRRADASLSVFDALYRDVQLLVLESGHLGGAPVPWELQVARFLAPAIAGYVGLKALAAIFRDQVGLFLVRLLPPEVVVCGLGQRGLTIARSLRERGKRVLIIERDEANQLIGPSRRTGAIVFVGDATEPELLQAVRVHRARHVICVCEDDRTNAEIAIRTRELALRRGSQSLTCNVHVVDPQLYSLLKAYELGGHHEAGFRLDCFNVFEVGARTLLKEHPPLNVPGAEEEAHLMVVGLGRLGERLIVHAARVLGAQSTALRATVVDRDAERKTAAMLCRYPQLRRACNLVPCQIDLTSPEFESFQFLRGSGTRYDFNHVYVCLADESLGITVALKLRQQLEERKVPIVVRMARTAGLGSLLGQEAVKEGGSEVLQGFGLLDRTCEPDLVLGGTYEVIARAIHEEYVRGQVEDGQTPETNASMVPWDELPEALRESNRAQASHIGAKLRAVGCTLVPLVDWDAERFAFTPEEVEVLAEKEHERWMEERRRAGWTYAPGPKDIHARTSPYMVPWVELSDEVKEKDRDGVRGTPAFLARVDLQIVRLGWAGANGGSGEHTW